MIVAECECRAEGGTPVILGRFHDLRPALGRVCIGQDRARCTKHAQERRESRRRRRRRTGVEDVRHALAFAAFVLASNEDDLTAALGCGVQRPWKGAAARDLSHRPHAPNRRHRQQQNARKNPTKQNKKKNTITITNHQSQHDQRLDSNKQKGEKRSGSEGCGLVLLGGMRREPVLLLNFETRAISEFNPILLLIGDRIWISKRLRRLFEKVSGVW